MTDSGPPRPVAVEDLIEFHDIVLGYGGGREGFNYFESLYYAVDRPFLTLFGVEQYPGPFLKAAVIMENIIQGHPFTDGNKRTGYLAGLTLLELLTGFTVEAGDDEVAEICLKVEDKRMPAEELAAWMEDHAVTAEEEEE